MSQSAPRGGGAQIPRATYRLQLNKDFTFRAATAVVPYLAELGVSHVYCSPYLRARPGSMHGYDIIDHGSFNPEIGTAEDFEAFSAELKRHGMGQVLDIVPNHMGVLGADNAWWLDVLENGQASRYADYFDIDWQPASPELANRVLLPVLGDHYGLVLDRGEIVLSFDAAAGAFRVDYYDHRFPVDPCTYPTILGHAVDEEALAQLSPEALTEVGGLGLLFLNLPDNREQDVARKTRRDTEKEALKRRLADLVAAHPPLARAIARAVELFNGGSGNRDAMHELLEEQAYRLSYWRVASDEINYRRFFDVNHLAALRMEHPGVFEDTHRFVFDLIEKGHVHGLRIDHPDGLRDPGAYFQALQDRYAKLPNAQVSEGDKSPLYVVIEKIIASFEHIPDSWAMHGTTGYRFANLLSGVMVDTQSEAKITRIYEAFVGKVPAFAEVAYRSRRLVLRDLLASELTVLANQLRRIAAADRRTRDYTLNTLRQALAEVIACFPLYRTYITARQPISDDDRRYIDWAVSGARRRSRTADTTVFDFVRSMLLCEAPAGASPQLAEAIFTFATKAQQVTAPVMAKGIEDTSFYIYNRLISLNDVGGDPETYGFTVRAFHGANADRTSQWPHAMLTSSTHDNKRSEDVRARINVLAELPALWRLHLRRWSRTNRSKKRMLEGELAPSRNDEYLLYQTLLGSFPEGEIDSTGMAAYCERIEQYMVKAMREAKVDTSWITPNQAYEEATIDFVRALLNERKRNLFLEKFRGVVAPLARLGLYNSLSMALLKNACPGVPDTYQGNELWDFSLVDPDNRRPVDYVARRQGLARLREMAPAGTMDGAYLRGMIEAPRDGLAKLYVTWRLLALRREYEAVLRDGDYTPLATEGKRADHVVAFARRYQGRGIIVLAGRLYGALSGNGETLPVGEAAWQDTVVNLPFLAEGTALRHAFTGASLQAGKQGLRLAEACADFPVAVLIYDEGELRTE